MVLLAVFMAGCGSEKEDANTKVVLTTGFAKDEIFRIESISCTLPEIMVYLTNTQNQYERVYGPEIWQANVEGITLEQNIKDTALARIAQIKSMNLLAAEHGVELTAQEKGYAAAAAKEYYGSLNDTERELMGVSEELIERLYAEYGLANKVYHFIIRDINHYGAACADPDLCLGRIRRKDCVYGSGQGGSISAGKGSAGTGQG